MTRETKSTINIEIEVPVSGRWARAEPDVGLNEGFFEDAEIEWVPTIWKIMDATEKAYAEQIQEALAEQRQSDMERADDRRDEAADAQMHYERENRP